MPVTVIEQIALELVSRLETITGSNTYVSEIIRPTRLNTESPKHLQIMLTQSKARVVEELSHPGNPPAIAREVVFNIRCHIMSDETEITPVDTISNNFSADVIKAVCMETEWYHFNGLAINAEWQDNEDVNADGGMDGVNVPLAIIYRTDEDDPYVVRA